MADREFRTALEGGSYVEGPRWPDDLRLRARWDDGRTLLVICAPDFDEHTRAPVRDAVLVSTDDSVSRAGSP